MTQKQDAEQWQTEQEEGERNEREALPPGAAVAPDVEPDDDGAGDVGWEDAEQDEPKHEGELRVRLLQPPHPCRGVARLPGQESLFGAGGHTVRGDGECT